MHSIHLLVYSITMKRRSKSRSKSRSRTSKSKSKSKHATKQAPARVPAHTKKVPTSHHAKPKITVEKADGPVRLPSKGSKSHTRERPTHANKEMTMTDLQFMAKSRGIQFGGLNKSQLVEKINRY
jgi:hypothetical protein